jgi:hypothetical protein
MVFPAGIQKEILVINFILKFKHYLIFMGPHVGGLCL